MDDIDALMYTIEDGTERKVPIKQKRLLKHILMYYDFEMKQHASKQFEARDWLKLDATTFNTFRREKVPLFIHEKGTVSSATALSVAGITYAHVTAFDLQQKRDVRSYNKFNSHPKL